MLFVVSLPKHGADPVAIFLPKPKPGVVCLFVDWLVGRFVG